MKAVLKSLGFGMVGASLAFAFFALIAVPILTTWARLHNPNTPLEAGDVMIEPIRYLRMIGIPISGAAFVACFVLGWRKFARTVTPVEHRS